MRDQQFPELLALLLEIKNLRIDNVKVSLGRMQNFMNSACIEHLDFRYFGAFINYVVMKKGGGRGGPLVIT